MGHEFIDSDYENMKFTFGGKTHEGYYGREIVSLTDGESLSLFEDGTPAVVKKKTGKGEVITFNTYLWYSNGKSDSLSSDIASLLAKEYGLRSISAPISLKVRTAENGKYRYAFVFNYTEKEVNGHISGEGFDADVSLTAHDVKILRTEIA